MESVGRAEHGNRKTSPRTPDSEAELVSVAGDVQEDAFRLGTEGSFHTKTSSLHSV